MQTLFLDLASNKQLLALTNDTRVLVIRKSDTRFDEAELMSLIKALCKEAGGTLIAINRIACTTGPGGFMSQRVGAALANALAYSLKVPVAGIHLSDLWFARAIEEQPSSHDSLATTRYPLPATRSFVWVHSTKRTHLFVRGFGDYAKQWPEAILIEAKELSALPAKTRIAGELIDEHAALSTQCERLTELKPIEDVLPKLLNDLTYGNEQILPWYGREA